MVDRRCYDFYSISNAIVDGQDWLEMMSSGSVELYQSEDAHGFDDVSFTRFAREHNREVLKRVARTTECAKKRWASSLVIMNWNAKLRHTFDETCIGQKLRKQSSTVDDGIMTGG
eukprot:2233492-Pyramimonas_sp.AAC.1